MRILLSLGSLSDGYAVEAGAGRAGGCFSWRAGSSSAHTQCTLWEKLILLSGSVVGGFADVNVKHLPLMAHGGVRNCCGLVVDKVI